MTAVYLTDGERILLLYRQGSRVVNRVWIGAAGGHMEVSDGGDPRACILREMREELGLGEADVRNLRLRYITLRRDAAEIRQNHYYFAEWPGGSERELTSPEGELRWFSIDELDGLPMPYSAGYMIRHWLEVGRQTDEMYVGTACGEGVFFACLPEVE